MLIPMPASNPTVTGRERNWVIQPPRITPIRTSRAPTINEISISAPGSVAPEPSVVASTDPAAPAASIGAIEESGPTERMR